MKHFIDSIPAWISGELDSDQAAELERHLKQCPECAAEAEQQRAIWEALEAANPAGDLDAAPSLWPGVRARTFGGRETAPWFFGSNLLVRSSLAACAVAAGLLFSVTVPGGLTTDTAAASDEQVENIWLEDSSFTDSETAYDLDGVWLAAGLDEEG